MFLINRFVIVWNLQGQKIVTLSVTESEYSKTSGVYCKILFFRAVLLYIGFLSNTPLLCTLISLEKYSHSRTHLYCNRKNM